MPNLPGNPLEWTTNGSYILGGDGWEQLLYDLSGLEEEDGFMGWVLEAIQNQYRREFGLLD